MLTALLLVGTVRTVRVAVTEPRSRDTPVTGFAHDLVARTGLVIYGKLRAFNDINQQRKKEATCKHSVPWSHHQGRKARLKVCNLQLLHQLGTYDTFPSPRPNRRCSHFRRHTASASGCSGHSCTGICHPNMRFLQKQKKRNKNNWIFCPALWV